MKYSKEEKAMWLEDWERSGKGAWVYAKENGLIPQTFFGWTRKRRKTTNDFVEIKAKSTIILPAAMMLIEKGDIKIQIPLGANNSEVEAVIRSLRRAI